MYTRSLNSEATNYSDRYNWAFHKLIGVLTQLNRLFRFRGRVHRFAQRVMKNTRDVPIIKRRSGAISVANIRVLVTLCRQQLAPINVQYQENLLFNCKKLNISCKLLLQNYPLIGNTICISLIHSSYQENTKLNRWFFVNFAIINK